MDNDSILSLAVDTANTIAIQNKITKSEDLSALITDYYLLFKKLLEDTTA